MRGDRMDISSSEIDKRRLSALDVLDRSHARGSGERVRRWRTGGYELRTFKLRLKAIGLLRETRRLLDSLEKVL